MLTDYESQKCSLRNSLIFQSTPSRFSTNMSTKSGSPCKSSAILNLHYTQFDLKRHLDKSSKARKKTLNINFSAETISTVPS